jgi:hypothetical protein
VPSISKPAASIVTARTGPVSFWNVPLFALLGTFALLVLPAILFGTSANVRHIFHEDSVIAHLPMVNYFLHHPLFERTYLSASAITPGYHIFLAVLAKLAGYSSVDETTWITRAVNAAMGFGVLVMLWAVLRRLNASRWTATALCLPLACSNYVISPAIWILTDDVALLLYTATLFIVLFDRGNGVLAGVTGFFLSWSRQLFLPVLGVYGVELLRSGRSMTWREIGMTTLAILPGLSIVIYYALAWHGLTPPTYQAFNRSAFLPSVPLNALALTGLLALPFSLTILRAFATLDKRHVAFVALGFALLTVVLWAFGQTNFDSSDGRYGSLIWLLSKHTPILGDHSPIVLILALLGGGVLAIMLVHAYAEEYYPAETVMLLLYYIANSAQVMAWQRYIEPVMLVTLAVFCVRVGNLRQRELIGPLAYAALFGLLTMGRLYGPIESLLA